MDPNATFYFTIAMDLDKIASKLNKKIEKLTTILTDSTALTPAQHQAKEGERVNLRQQVTAVNQQLPPPVVTKIIHKN